MYPNETANREMTPVERLQFASSELSEASIRLSDTGAALMGARMILHEQEGLLTDAFERFNDKLTAYRNLLDTLGLNFLPTASLPTTKDR